jgi:2-dehydro-3-deoxyphosphooctonate aldolase (KDO 8-P synthase)
MHRPAETPRSLAGFSRVAQVLQIPAFLCRQTDLLQAAGATHRVVHLKKGQWCAPAVATAAAVKLYAAGGAGVVLCDRGTQFGYNDLVMDVRNLEEMRVPVTNAASAAAGLPPPVLISADVTHALQRPCGQVGADGRVCSGGSRRLVPAVARACAAAGADGIFLEVHDNPAAAPVDGPTQWPLRALRPLLRELMAVSAASRARGRAGREPSLEPAGDDWTPDDEDESSDEW